MVISDTWAAAWVFVTSASLTSNLFWIIFRIMDLCWKKMEEK